MLRVVTLWLRLARALRRDSCIASSSFWNCSNFLFMNKRASSTLMGSIEDQMKAQINRVQIAIYQEHYRINLLLRKWIN
ncbi:hypothetical protein Lalb_Chr21g0315521 [Lupinus albus]|uniref:Uncharacterized protein n=1 Tax=Lupinus albus TaxID=3870 RepID=A0A6A4NU63_LUPAL|nr:hypothetical protein Lalb_Chr21g0315521 [Lupinus albus]